MIVVRLISIRSRSRRPSGAFSPLHFLAINVFTRKDGAIRHFWASELSGKTADPGQDSRGAPELMPLWNILDNTPEGRGTDWYPKLDYPS